MARTAPQFDPIEQLSSALNVFEIKLAEIETILPRMRFAFERIESELGRVREQRDRLDYYTEAEAAALLKLKEDQFATLRRLNDLPHVRFGMTVRYTRQHLDQITDFFDSRNAGKPHIRKAA